MNDSEQTALVFGASGITGWAITRLALEYPISTTFSRVIGLTNRPLSLAESFLPNDPKLSLQSGVDLSGSIESIVASLREIDGIEKTTHVYFTAYVHIGWGAEDSQARTRVNVEILLNSIKAVDQLCPNLQFVTWCTGGKWYGFEHEPYLQITAPLRESNARIPPPHGDHIFYYAQHDALASYAAGKKWTFADIRPDAIVGFVPNNNPMNLAQPIAIYLGLWRSLNPRKPAPFPGTRDSYIHMHSDISQDQLAKTHIWVSLHPKQTAGGSFNTGDSNEGFSWEMVWPGICSYFGLEAAGPPEGDDVAGEAWVMLQKDKWTTWEQEHELKGGVVKNTAWDFLTIVVGEYSVFDRRLDLSLVRELGFKESADHVQGYYTAFERMRKAKMIPTR